MPEVLYLTSPDDPLTEKVHAAAGGRLRLEISSDPAALAGADRFDALLIGDIRFESKLAGAIGPKFIQLTRGDHMAVDAMALAKSGVTVAGSSPALAEFVAEHALALASTITWDHGPRGLISREETARSFIERRAKLGELKLGVIGFGRVGQALVGKASGLFKSVVYSDVRTASHSVAAHLGVRRSTLDLLLSTCDVVSLHVQWGPTSNPLIGERELRLMGKTAVLVNTADGRLVDERALIAALGAGEIGGAALDVVSTGAPNSDHPLTGMRDTALTPYIAARTGDADNAVASFVIGNIERALTGERPKGLIEVTDFPRSGDPSFWSSYMAPRE
jgi:phosphoglycerate dehydrogenase-like enzyme